MLLALAAGCSQTQPQFQPVHGKVMYRGAALAQGTIVFAPDASRGYRGPLSLELFNKTRQATRGARAP